MATNTWGRDEILGNFQAATGNEDFASCLQILESYGWDLQLALNSYFQDQETQPPTSNSRNSPIIVDDPPAFINLDPTPETVGNLQTDSASSSSHKTLTFEISWHTQNLTIALTENQTVEELKRLLHLQTDVAMDEINLEGWPSGDSAVQSDTILSTLNLSSVTHLVFHVPAKVTVSPAEYLACNIPDIASQRKEDENKEFHAPRAINVSDSFNQETSAPQISLNVHHNGRDYRLRYNRNETVKDVKRELFILTKINTRNQEWNGWPEGANDNSKLSELDLASDHFLLIRSKEGESSSGHTFANEKPMDSGTAGSVEDSEDELMIMHNDEDYDDDAIFDNDAAQSKKPKTLLARDSNDTFDVMIQFQHNFVERYGDVHPPFYVGPLKNAIEEAGGSRAAERRPLLLYLHHDSSVLTHIFCSQILCSQQLVSYVTHNFVTWPWDMSHESNRQRFVNMLVLHFGNSAASTVSKYRDSDYPLLLIVMKSKAGLEVCSILQANASLDEVMMSLINGYEVFEQAKLVEIKSENERTERDLMKQEQDAAYHESLAADRAKVQAEKERHSEEMEKMRQEQEVQDMREAERASCEEQLPDEPPSSAKNTTNIRFRFPNGETEQRRFYEHQKLNVIFMYVTSKGFSMNSNEHRIVTNFPRRQLSEDSLQRTLKELKLCPRENLFVEEI